jgi:predicted RND superfamily exporter protein
MERFAETIIRLRIPILLIVLGLTVWLASYVPRIRFDSSSDGSVPLGDPEQAFFEETIETFGNDQVSVVVVDVPGEVDVFNRQTLEQIERLTYSIQKVEAVEEVISLTNARYLTGADIIETPLVIPEIPQNSEEMNSLRDFVLDNDLFLKTLVSEDGKAAAINIFVRDYPDSVLIALDIDGRIQDIIEAEQGPEHLHYAGLTYTRRVINATMHRDLRIFVPLTLALITLILFLTFRSFRGVLLPLLTVAISTTCTVGLLGLFNKPMSLVMTILPPLLIAIGSSYSIHVVSHFNDGIRNNLGSRDSARGALKDLTLPMTMTAFTTIVGFGSLLVNPIPNISKMGLFAMIGIAFTFLIALTVLPSILSLLRMPRVRQLKAKSTDILDNFLGWLAGFNQRRRAWVAVMAFLVAAVSVWGTLIVKVDTNFLSYFDEESDIRKTTDIISEKLAGASTFFLVIDGKEPDSMKRPELLRSVDRIQQYMEEMPGVDKTVSIVGHLKRLHSALNYDDPDSLIVPGHEGVIEEELLLFSISHDPGAIERYVNGDFSQITVFARTSLVGSSDILGALRQITDFARSELPPGYNAKPTGTLVVLTHATEAVSRGQRDSLALALVIIFIVMTVLFRSLRAGFLSMIPNALPILIVFGMMGWSGTTLNLGTSIIACTAIGISVDDTIHFMTDYGRRMRKKRDSRLALEGTILAIGRPLIYTSVTLFFGFLILSLSNFQMISSVGFLTGTTMLTALGADLVLLPVILTSTRALGRQPEGAEDTPRS